MVIGRLRRILIGGVCVSLLLAATGCSDDSGSGAVEERDPLPSAVSQGSPSPSASESTWTPPSPAKPPKGGWPEDQPATEISAEKVVRLWIKAYSRASVTGDTSRMRRIALPRCTECTKYADEIDQERASGEVITFDGPAIVPTTLSRVDAKSTKHVELQMLVKVAGGTRTGTSSSTIRFDAETYEWFFALTTHQGRWRIKRTAFVG